MKKHIHILCSALLAFSMIFSLVGCNSVKPTPSAGNNPSNSSAPSNSAEPSSSGSEATGPAEAIELLAASATAAGSFYAWNVAAASIVNKYITNLTVSPVATGSGSENLDMVDAGQVQLGGTGGFVEYQAFTGIDGWDGRPQTNMQIVQVLYPDYFQLVVPADSPYNTLEDLRGKRIATELAGGSGNQEAMAIFNALGFTDFTSVSLSTADSASALQDGSIDAYTYAGGAGSASMQELASTRTGLKLISLTPEQIKTVTEAIPMLTPHTYPANTFKNQDYEVQTVGSYTYIITRNDVSEDAIYWYVRALNEHNDEMVNAMATAAYSTAENTYLSAKDLPIPIHSGALRYYQELGLIK